MCGAGCSGYHILTADKESFQLDYCSHAGQATFHQFGLALPLATTSGLLTQATTKGYQADGWYLLVYDRVTLVNLTRQVGLILFRRKRLSARTGIQQHNTCIIMLVSGGGLLWICV